MVSKMSHGKLIINLSIRSFEISKVFSQMKLYDRLWRIKLYKCTLLELNLSLLVSEKNLDLFYVIK